MLATIVGAIALFLIATWIYIRDRWSALPAYYVLHMSLWIGIGTDIWLTYNTKFIQYFPLYKVVYT